jgi:hypothetical protein
VNITRIRFSEQVLKYLLGSLISLPLHAQTVAPVPEIYTCIDAKGRKLTSDRQIVECNDREQKILNPSGTVKARIGPVLTTYERLQLEARNKADQDGRAAKEEEKRRDRALLNRYPNQILHQKERADAQAQISLVKQVAASRVIDLRAEQTKLNDELAFYAKDPSKAPPKLKRQIEEVTQTLAAQERFLVDKDIELKRINARFDEELQRLIPLWRMATAGGVVPPPP